MTEAYSFCGVADNTIKNRPHFVFFYSIS